MPTAYAEYKFVLIDTLEKGYVAICVSVVSLHREMRKMDKHRERKRISVFDFVIPLRRSIYFPGSLFISQIIQ